MQNTAKTASISRLDPNAPCHSIWSHVSRTVSSSRGWVPLPRLAFGMALNDSPLWTRRAAARIWVLASEYVPFLTCSLYWVMYMARCPGRRTSDVVSSQGADRYTHLT